MDCSRFARACASIVAVITVALLHSHEAHAQGAWVGDPNSLTTTLSYQYVPSTNIVLTPTREVLDRPTTNHVVTLEAEYVPIENLAIELFAPFAAVRYDGKVPHTPPGKWDDGKFHYTPEDFRFGVRYQILDEPYLALSPYVAGTFAPSGTAIVVTFVEVFASVT